MNRKAVSMASIFLVLILGLVVTPATAGSDKTYWSFGSFAMAYFSLTPPSQPTMLLRVEAMDYKISSAGPYDALLLSIWVGPPIEDYVPVAGVTDNEETAALMEAMFAFLPTFSVQLVEDDELEVWRKGRKLFASLTVPPSVPIMPLYIEFEGYGCIEFARATIPLPTTYTLRLWYIKSYATAQVIVGPWTLTADEETFVGVISFMTITGPAI